MKVIKMILFSVLLVPALAFASIPSSDKQALQKEVMQIEDYVNSGDVQGITDRLSPNARDGLREEIEAALSGKSVQFEESINSYEEQPDGTILVKGSYKAEGTSWNTSGFSNYFIFEKVDGELLLVDTDFQKGLSGEMPSWFFLLIFGIPFIIFGPLFIFWIIMLIDAAKRGDSEFPNGNSKLVWTLLLVFGGFMGAIIYYFVVKKKYPRGVATPPISNIPPPAPPLATN